MPNRKSPTQKSQTLTLTLTVRTYRLQWAAGFALVELREQAVLAALSVVPGRHGRGGARRGAERRGVERRRDATERRASQMVPTGSDRDS